LQEQGKIWGGLILERANIGGNGHPGIKASENHKNSRRENEGAQKKMENSSPSPSQNKQHREENQSINWSGKKRGKEESLWSEIE